MVQKCEALLREYEDDLVTAESVQEFLDVAGMRVCGRGRVYGCLSVCECGLQTAVLSDVVGIRSGRAFAWAGYLLSLDFSLVFLLLCSLFLSLCMSARVRASVVDCESRNKHPICSSRCDPPPPPPPLFTTPQACSTKCWASLARRAWTRGSRRCWRPLERERDEMTAHV